MVTDTYIVIICVIVNITLALKFAHQVILKQIKNKRSKNRALWCTFTYC